MNNKIIVMGVSGCGKSLIASKIAEHFDLPFFDGDDFHPQENVYKMANGIPLNDEDRSSWLITLNRLINDNNSLVLACSALTQDYRDKLKSGNAAVQFIYLKGSSDLIWSRLKLRTDHYFAGEAMLKSQFETLVEPSANEAITVDINQSVEAVVDNCVALLSSIKSV